MLNGTQAEVAFTRDWLEAPEHVRPVQGRRSKLKVADSPGFRIPPHNLEAEQALLGAILIDNETYGRIADALNADHFFEPLHQQIYRTAAEFIAFGKKADPITLSAFFENSEPIDGKTTVPMYLVRLAVNTATLAYVRDYAQTIIDLAIRRRLILIGEDMVTVAYDSPVDFPPLEQVTEVARRIESLAQAAPTSLVPSGSVPYVSRCLADISPRHIEWLWPLRFAKGKVNLIAGQPGLGKTQVTTLMAARVTVGGEWPDGSACPRGSVVIICCEDDAADTIVPRLMAAGADLRRVHIFDWVIKSPGGHPPSQHLFSLAHDIPALTALVNKLGDVVLIVIDPVSAYLSGLDSHKTSDVRGGLAPMQHLASETGAAVVLVSHLNKGSADANAMARVAGSGAFVATARSAWLVESDPDDEHRKRRILTPLKNNIGDDQTGFAFEIKPVKLEGGIETSRVVFEPAPVVVSASELLRGRQESEEERGLLGEAMDFLREYLADGPKGSKVTQKAAEAAGVADRTLRRARERLKVSVQRSRVTTQWVWALPEHADSGQNNDGVGHVDHLGQEKNAGHLTSIHASAAEFGQAATCDDPGQDGQHGQVGQHESAQ